MAILRSNKANEPNPRHGKGYSNREIAYTGKSQCDRAIPDLDPFDSKMDFVCMIAGWTPY
jgi:hypothetical protein